MKVTAEIMTGWEWAKRAALATVGLKPTHPQPTDQWKADMLLAEHSPIRCVTYYVSIQSIRQWVTTHLVRHWLGFIPFIHTQREDRRVLDCARDELPQGSLNDMDFKANAQALINISRKRLCRCASSETRQAWQEVHQAIRKVDPIMADKMVPNCIYRGFCPEGKKSCGFYRSMQFQIDLDTYRQKQYEPI